MAKKSKEKERSFWELLGQAWQASMNEVLPAGTMSALLQGPKEKKKKTQTATPKKGWNVGGDREGAPPLVEPEQEVDPVYRSDLAYDEVTSIETPTIARLGGAKVRRLLHEDPRQAVLMQEIMKRPAENRKERRERRLARTARMEKAKRRGPSNE